MSKDNDDDDDENENENENPSIDSDFCLARSFVPNCLDEMLIIKLGKDKLTSQAPKLERNTFSNSVGTINGKSKLYTMQKQSSIKIKEFVPKSLSFNGICLIADISGFTKLSSKLCSLGKDGVDELQKATNGFMSKLVDSIYEYDGDIIKFAGDAIICTFQPKLITAENKHMKEEELIQEACIRALECTWKLKDHRTQDMTMHIAIGYGFTHLSLLGGFKDNWEVLVSGKYLCNLGGCLDEAGVGEIVTTTEFFDVMNGSTSEEKSELPSSIKASNKFCEISGEFTASRNIKVTSVNKFESTKPLNPIDRLIVESYKDYYNAMQKVVPLPIIRSLTKKTFDTLAQLREVTTMFMKFDGYDCNEHSDILKLQQHFFEAQKLLNESGGFLRQFLVDDKGCVLIGIWGIPEYAHVDNGKRALITAIEIRERLLDMKMKASFGITTGSVYCGLVGSSIRREYCVIGSVVNLAARLMGKSKGSVLMDQTTYDKLELNARNLLLVQEPILVKGIATPVTTYLYDTSKPIAEVQQVVEVPLRSICKEALNHHVIELAKGKTTFGLGDGLASVTRRLAMSKNKLIRDDSAKVNIHIIEGNVGMGSEEIRPWLKKKAEQLNLAMVSVEASEPESYSVVKNIFVSLISHDAYYNRAKQGYVVHRILKDLYESNSRFMEKVAYPVMRIVFGVNVPFKKPRKYDIPAVRSERIVSSELAQDELPPVEFVNTHACKKVAYEILTYLISERSHIILVEKAHCIDEDSWRILSMFVEGTMKAMFVFTQEPISHYLSDDIKDEIKSLRNMKTIYLPTVMYEKDLLKYDNVHFLNLPKYSYQETRAHFLYRMNYNFNLPARLDLYVYKLSGGNPFWIGHIISFINEEGVDEFMDIMGSAEGKLRTPDRRISLFSSFTATSTRELLKVPERSVTTRSINTTETSADATTEHFDSIGKLQHFILCRLEKLSLESQEVLRNASIIGNEFSESLLCSCVIDALHSKLKPMLSSLVESGWIYNNTRSSSKDVSYLFCHEVFRDALYELSPKSLKEIIHAKIAEFMIEKNMIDNEIVAYHFLRSGPDTIHKSFDYSLNAAEAALKAQLYDEFFRNISNSIKAINHSIDRARTLHKILNMANNNVRTAMIKRAVSTSNDTIYTKFMQYFSCRRTHLILDNTIRTHEYVLERIKEMSDEIGLHLPKESPKEGSPLKKAPTRSKSFFVAFRIASDN